MRNDSALFTGATSQQMVKIKKDKENRESRKQARKDKKTKIFPVASEFIELIEKEKDNATLQILSQVDSLTGDDYEAVIKSLRQYRQSMNNLIGKVNMIMRTTDDKEVEEKDD